MKSVYTTIAGFNGDERCGTPYQTQILRGGDATILARAACYLGENHICPRHYELRHRRGSLTFQHVAEPHDVLKLFFDSENELAPGGDRNLVYGFELTELAPQAIEGARMRLAAVFGPAYLDPRVPGFTKYELLPNQQRHFYDLAIDAGVADYQVQDESRRARLEAAIREAIQQDLDGDIIDWQ
jgi:hypothetical protein